MPMLSDAHAEPGPAHHRAAEELRIAYFLTSYGSGAQLSRLVATLLAAQPDCHVVIRHDTFSSTLNPALFAGEANVHVLPAGEKIVWGDMSLEAARWDVFRWILANLDVDWVVLLSEQDYPLQPLDTLRINLATSGADAFISGERIDEISDPVVRREAEIRYLYQYLSLPHVEVVRRLPASWQARVRWMRGYLITAVTRSQKKFFIYETPEALNLPTRIGFRPKNRTPFSAEFPCWQNDCWCALSRKALQHVVRYLDAHPEFVRYYGRTVIPLESATATIVFNDPDLIVRNAPTHTIRWSDPHSGRPDVFTRDDLDFLRSAGTPFARKFSATDTGVLDELDAVVLSKPQEIQ